jgi:alanyl-tRNA synthetase
MVVLDIVVKRFSEFGLPLSYNESIIPGDATTLFVTAGMQPLKKKFTSQDHTGMGTVQSCLRTSDLDSVGDGQHLTFFCMLGSFGFGTYNYELHVELWSAILKDLRLSPLTIHVHPSSTHRRLWEVRGYSILDNSECLWSDGEIGGYCSEVFYNTLEVGNLVNPLEHSVDVGFGMERLVQLVEGKSRVDETGLFRQDLDPISRDHFRALSTLYEQGVKPGNKRREYVCRRLLRRFVRLNSQIDSCPFAEWVEAERELLDAVLQKARRYYRRNGVQTAAFWWDTFGLLPEEIVLL